MQRTAPAIIAISLLFCTTGCADTTSVEPPAETEWGFDETEPAPDEQRDETPGDPDLNPTPVTPDEPLDPVVETMNVSGAWVQDTIGNCIAIEDWIVLAGDGALERVLLDRNACGEPTLRRQVGRWSTDGPRLRMRWSDEDRTTVRTATALTFEESERHAMNLMGYVSDDAARFQRVDQTVTTGDIERDSRVAIDVTFDPALDTAVGSPCQMTVELHASADGSTGSEEFEFDCLVEDVDGRRVVYAEGMWRSTTSDAWMELFRERGIWDRYPARLSNLMYDAFRPVFFVDPDRPGRLWHDNPRAWYRFTDQSPPTSLEEIGD